MDELLLRRHIAQKITDKIKPYVKGVLIGGSVGIGHVVHKKSDIDLVIITTKDRFSKLAQALKAELPVELFVKGEINLAWETQVIDGVEVNMFIYEEEGYTDFCTIKGPLIGWLPEKPSEQQTSYSFSGQAITFNRHVRPYSEGGYFYEKPALAMGHFWGGPPRQDFLHSYYLVYQETRFVQDLEQKVWKATVKQLLRENASEEGILKSHHSFHQNKLPKNLQELILSTTRRFIRLGLVEKRNL